jgi:hypothetical protein
MLNILRVYRMKSIRANDVWKNAPTQIHLVFSDTVIDLVHVKWVHCHHGMARPRLADTGYGLEIWRVAANILNKQSRTADSGWSSSLGVGRGLTTLPHKTHYLLRITTHSLGTGRNTWHNLSTEKWT